MKRIILSFVVALLASTSLWAQQEESVSPTDSCLMVWHKDGSKVLFDLDESPKITYIGDSVVIESAATIKFAFQAIKKMTFDAKPILDRIAETPVKAEKPFTSHGGTITFLPAGKDMHVRVISLNGIVVKDFTVKKDEPASISLRQYHAKIYLINVDGVTYKIAVR